VKPVATHDDGRIKPFFKMADPHRECWLRQAAIFCRAREMPVSRQRDKTFEIP
jgi:hypothetical protein